MRKWKRYLTGALAAGTAVCMAVYPALAAPEDTAEQAGEEDGLFQVRESPLPVQSYDSGGYRIDVYGAFTQMTGPDGAVTSLEDSRLLYKRGTMLSVSSEFDFYGDRPDQVVVDSVSGEGGTTQYLSVLESDRSLEDYYTQIEWPDELPNSNIVEISSTLDTAGLPEPDLLIRTCGEQRISNFLLWQLAYTEFYFTPVAWPDFTKEELEKAVEAYNHRDRRYGLVKDE